MTDKKIWMTDEEYLFVTKKIPIHCVDLVILRKNNKVLETLLLVRKTGYEKGKYCIIGGRQRLGETAKDTVIRQAAELGVEVSILTPFDYDFPAWVNSRHGQDSTKQPVCSVYPVKIIGGEILPEGSEYSSYKWFPVDKLPQVIAYDHRFEIEIVLKQLEKFRSL